MTARHLAAIVLLAIALVGAVVVARGVENTIDRTTSAYLQDGD